MSHEPYDDDALDVALRQLGAPLGAEPVAPAGDLLARAAVPATPAPLTASRRSPMRAGLAGMPLAAALVAAVGAGFFAGTLATRATAPAPAPDSGPREDAIVAGPTEGLPPQRHADTRADRSTDGDAASARARASGDGVAPARVGAASPRAHAGGRPVARRALAPARKVPPPQIVPSGRIVDEVVYAAGTPAASAVEGVSGALAATEQDGHGEDPAAVARAGVAGRTPGRRREATSRAVDVPSARAGRLHVGVGAALSSLGVEAPARGVRPEHADARSAELVVGYARRVSDAALAPWVGVDAGFGRVWAVSREDDTAVPALPTWSADASAGVSWAVGPARIDLGLGLGTRGLPGGAWAAHRDDGDDDDPEEPNVSDARLDDPSAPGPLALVGPRLNLSLGGERGPRARLGLAPSVALRPGHRPDAWVQLSLGGELPG